VRPTRQADLVLLHPPSVYDFREKLLVGSPIADLVPSSSIFEMYPIGFSFLGEYLDRHGITVRVVNLAARMLEQPRFDVEKFIKKLTPRAFGIDLHWLPHCQGAVEIARLCKRLHPEIPVIMGGYSASIYHRELLEYPEIDYVVRGDSAEEPLLQLMKALLQGEDIAGIPNISYRFGEGGRIVENELEYIPATLDHIQDNYAFMARSALQYRDLRGIRAFKNWWSYPMTAVLTCKGCLNDCTFCGGSAWSMWRCFRRSDLALRSAEMVARDVETIASITGAPIFIIGDILQPGREYAWEVLERLGSVAPRNHLVFELFEPAPREFFERLHGSIPNYDLEISPDSHDVIIRRAAGKHYSNEQLEGTIKSALANGCARFDVFFMIGLEGQTPRSVMDSVDYCDHLLDRHGVQVHPLIGPLAPFLDPGSLNQAHPEKHGYRLLLHSLEEHRNALLQPHWRDTLGYETRWMSRQEIVDTTYSAMLKLNRIKAARGQITTEKATAVENYLDGNVSLLHHLDASSAIEDPDQREAELTAIKPEADKLRLQSGLVKEELEWPIEGKTFYYANALRLASRKGAGKREKRPGPPRPSRLSRLRSRPKKEKTPAEISAQKRRRRIVGIPIIVLATLVSLFLLADYVYSRVASSEKFSKPPYTISISPDFSAAMQPLIQDYVNQYGKGKLQIVPLGETHADIVIDKTVAKGFAGTPIDLIPRFVLTAGDLRKVIRPASRYWLSYKQQGLLFKSKNQATTDLEDYLESYWDSLPSITYNAVGDIIPARHVAEVMAQRGVDYPFKLIAPVTRGADVVSGELESAMTNEVKPAYTGMYFSASPDAIEGIKMLGVNVLTLANNHITNFDRPALMDTIDILKANHIKYAGAGEDYAEAHSPAIVEAGGVKFAFLDYNSIEESINATADRSGVAWVTIPPDAEEMQVVEEDIREAKKQAQFVVVSFHWGSEYDYKPGSSVVTMARKVCDAGADMVIGQHPHTIQSMESYNGKLIAYSLGNFVFDQRFSEQVRDGVVLKCTFKKNVPVSAKLVPYRISNTCQTVPFKEGRGQYILDKLFEISGWRKQRTR
jgi:B12-binding domain/radical SAM domain protein